MNLPDIAVLERSAAAGDSSAMTQLGMRLLSGAGGILLPEKGTEWLTNAVDRGSAQACAQLAVLSGAGVCRPQSWDVALDYLQRSAEWGWEPAQRQLALLATNLAPTGERSNARVGDWASLRRVIDIATWTAVPPKEILSESPRIRTIRNFASDAVCAWMIDCARNRLGTARTYDIETGEGVVETSRTNSEADFNIVESDLVLLLLRARIAAVTDLPPAVMELTKVLHYSVGERFDPHFDFIDPATPGMQQEVAERGQRLVTFLLYLNDHYAGGETEFPAIGLRHQGRRGDALMFANVDLAGAPDRLTLHTGRAPTRGEKWLLSQWIRDRTPAARSGAN